MLTLRAIDHVGLKVSDMDRTLSFYQRLGLTLLRTSGPNAEGRRGAVIQVGSQEINIFSHPEYVAPGRGNHTGVDHFCLLVEAASIDELFADLRQAGLDTGKGPEERRDGTSLYIHDPDGVRIELLLKKSTAV